MLKMKEELYGHTKAGIIIYIHTMYVYFYNNNNESNNNNNDSLKVQKLERAERCGGENQEELL